METGGYDKFLDKGWKKAMSTGTRGPYRMVERRWIIEYMVRKCSNAIARWAHKRLGVIPPDLKQYAAGIPVSALRVYQPYVDLVCVFNDRVELIEFKVHDPIRAVSQLQLYRICAQQDPEILKYMPKPIVLKLVYWRYDAGLDALCKANGIVLEIEKPDWLDPILRDYGYKV